MLFTPQVVIVGAGLSGLRAASQIRDAGLSYVVVEAMNRPGGKVLSASVSVNGSEDAAVELGAAWINDSSQSKIYELALEYGIELVKQPVEGLSLEEDASGGIHSGPHGSLPSLTEEEQAEFIDISLLLDLLVSLINIQAPHLTRWAAWLDSMTAFEFADKIWKSSELTNRLVNVISRATLGVESGEVSALFFLDYLKSGGGLGNITSDLKDGAQYLRAAQGFQTIADGMAADLEVHVSSPVTRIVQTDEGVTVHTGNNVTYNTQKVIFSAPTALYHLVDFEPALPAAKQELISATMLGYYSKTILIFAEPWWRDANLTGVFTSEGPISITRDTSAGGQNSITCFLVGEPGRQWSRLDADERREAVLVQFRRAFGEFVDQVPEPVQVLEKEWTKDPWARGAPSPVMPPGILTSDAGLSLRKPFGHVHFVGTETAFEWKGYLEGAVRAGDRGAQEVIEKLEGCRQRS